MLEILVVDEASYMVDMITAAFLRSGYRVTPAENGTAAFQIVRGLRYDAVVTELVLPDMEGVELLKRIRSRDNIIPIVVFSCVEDIDKIVEAMREGADDYVRKRNDDLINTLRTVVERAIKRKKSEKRLQLFEGILPICAYCKKIRYLQDKEYVWVTIEQYFEEKKAGIEFSHGICSGCLKKYGVCEGEFLAKTDS